MEPHNCLIGTATKSAKTKHCRCGLTAATAGDGARASFQTQRPRLSHPQRASSPARRFVAPIDAAKRLGTILSGDAFIERGHRR
jgi:hypothetical protein